MLPILVVVLLLIVGVGIVAWSVHRHPSSRPASRRRDQDTAWNDPITPAAPTSADPTDPFAGASAQASETQR